MLEKRGLSTTTSLSVCGYVDKPLPSRLLQYQQEVKGERKDGLIQAGVKMKRITAGERE